jgi:hypothetical protein
MNLAEIFRDVAKVQRATVKKLDQSSPVARATMADARLLSSYAAIVESEGSETFVKALHLHAAEVSQ